MKLSNVSPLAQFFGVCTCEDLLDSGGLKGRRVCPYKVHHSWDLTSLGGVPREQKMLKGHLPSVMYYQVYKYTRIKNRDSSHRGFHPKPSDAKLVSQRFLRKTFDKSQLPHASVNLSFINTNISKKLTSLCRNWLLHNEFIICLHLDTLGVSRKSTSSAFAG